MNTGATTFRAYAVKHQIVVDAIVETPEEACELAASFPKSIKVCGCALDTPTLRKGYVSCVIRLQADRLNKGYNETGVRRYRRLRKILAERGYRVEWAMPYRNCITEEELEEELR